MMIEKTIKGQIRKGSVFLLFLLSAISLRSQDTIVYVFKETFENIENLNQSTIADKWQIRQTVYTESSQDISNIGGEHGKVWTSVYHAGKAAGYGDDGFAVDPVVGEFDELWFESDLFADPEFNPYSITGKYAGKMLFGFLGGNQYLGDQGWVLDSSVTGNGWTAQGVWGSGYALRPYYYDQIADGQTHQLNAHMLIPRGYWIHITRRVKMNTPGKKDGIFEVYANDSLVAQATDVEWRSFAQGKDYGKISSLHLAYFFGGSGIDYASQRDNFIRVDNLVAYYYTPVAKSYLRGPAPFGHKIPRNIPKDDLYPRKWLQDEVFTAASDTIQTHYHCGVFTPTSARVIKKVIFSSTDTIYLKFLSFEAGVDNHPDWNSYTKVYSGTGSSKELLYTFNNEHEPNSTYKIVSNSATIEFFSGNSQSEGWKLYYANSAKEFKFPTETAGPQPWIIAPSILTAKNKGFTSVLLNWTDNSGNENHFEIERTGPGSNNTRKFNLSANSTNFTDSGLDPNSTYEYKIRACDLSQCSSYAESAIISTPKHSLVPYEIQSVSAPCKLSDYFYVPVVKTPVDTLKDCIGFDVVMSFNKNMVKPTGRIRIGDDLITDISEAGYYTGIQDTAIYVSLFLNNGSLSSSSFKGTGQVMAVEFSKTLNCRPGDTAWFKVSSMIESYPSVSKASQVESGTYSTYIDSTFTGLLNFWSDGNPLRTGSLITDSLAVTRIYCANAEGTPDTTRLMKPDSTGNFTFHINDGRFLQIERDIPDETDMMPVINGIDAWMIKKVLVQDTTFKPNIYQIIAMDVNMDGIISAGDITQLYKRTMLLEGEYQQTWNYNNQGVSNGQPSKDWLFIPNRTLSLDRNYRLSESYPRDDHKGFSRFRVPKVPVNLPIPLDDFGTCKQLSDEGYKAILLGDANGSYKEVSSSSGLKRAGKSTEGNVIFDLSSAIIKEDFVDIPVLVQSDDPVYSLDFNIKINTGKIKFQSVINNSDNLESVAYFNPKDKTLRLTSNSLDSYNTEQPVLFIRIGMGSGSVGSTDMPAARVYLNGQAGAYSVKGQIEAALENPPDDPVVMYPNPAGTYCYVKTPGEAIIQIIDITGNVIPVNMTASADYEYKLDIQDLHNGIYLVKIKCGNQSMMKKLIVKH
jgi:hypothetical protein